MAAVSVGELGGVGVSGGARRAAIAHCCPSPSPGSAHLPAGAYPKAELGVHIHLVQYVCLVWAESASLSPTRTAYRHPSTCPPPLGDPGVQQVPQPGAQPCTPLGWCPATPQSQDSSPAPPRWLWSWGCHGREQSHPPPPSSIGWPGGAGDSWCSGPSPSGPCCWRCSRGSAPRTTARGHLWGSVSVGWGDCRGDPWDPAPLPAGTHRQLAGHGRGSACCVGCRGVNRRPGGAERGGQDRMCPHLPCLPLLHEQGQAGRVAQRPQGTVTHLNAQAGHQELVRQ